MDLKIDSDPVPVSSTLLFVLSSKLNPDIQPEKQSFSNIVGRKVFWRLEEIFEVLKESTCVDCLLLRRTATLRLYSL